MDEKQLNYEFMSILSESHPGLTFEEYRDCCVFLLFYHYLCLQYGDKLEEQYKLPAMVRLAIRGKLQLAAFLKFIQNAAAFLHLADGQFDLTEFAFYKKLEKIKLQEKQKSYARFIRKLIKKIDSWDSGELLLRHYGELFERLMEGFAKMKKESYISEAILALHRMFFDGCGSMIDTVFLPDFQYGILLDSMLQDLNYAEIYGYEHRENYIELLRIRCHLKGVPQEAVHLCHKEDWRPGEDLLSQFDAICIFMPDGVEPDTLLYRENDTEPLAGLVRAVTKGELPMILSALPLLAEDGVMTAVMPSAMLYREGREAQLRRYLVEEANCLDVVMLLPDHIFQSTGQNEVMLFFKMNRTERDVMFFDCSDVDGFEEEKIREIRDAWQERKTIPGFCSCIKKRTIEENEYNLNLPRYIARSGAAQEADIEDRRRRMDEIDRELKEIEERIAMYRRDLEL